jgi:hypothetical protein
MVGMRGVGIGNAGHGSVSSVARSVARAARRVKSGGAAAPQMAPAALHHQQALPVVQHAMRGGVEGHVT